MAFCSFCIALWGKECGFMYEYLKTQKYFYSKGHSPSLIELHSVKTRLMAKRPFRGTGVSYGEIPDTRLILREIPN